MLATTPMQIDALAAAEVPEQHLLLEAVAAGVLIGADLAAIRNVRCHRQFLLGAHVQFFPVWPAAQAVLAAQCPRHSTGGGSRIWVGRQSFNFSSQLDHACGMLTDSHSGDPKMQNA